ncbi:hypothetical protein FHX48_000494 [Microbacterium halimionae]|uniref:Uncharacterized protein n=1 Tax=Microbacterium halimionae TaxID=1526413 RepID=A0A7W3PL10_9MICO|nr:hypothetical protein [Microbacterium halimionae]MBA8815442.1 hypothetical protein [Microbacterium halimionae]NII95489.1 hypothetical protein [Microbacterium halimionae]
MKENSFWLATKLYWKTVGYAALAGTSASILTCAMVFAAARSLFGGENAIIIGPEAVIYGLVVGLLTWLFILVATLPLMRSLRHRRGLFVALAGLAPTVGWMLAILTVGAPFLSITPYFPVVGIVAGIGSATLAALATFFFPEAEPAEPR